MMRRNTVNFIRSTEDPARTGPLLVSFPHGVPSSADDMQIIPSFKVDGKKTKNVVSGKVDDLLFIAQDHGETSVRNDACKYAIGVIYDGSNDICLFPADHAFIMKPVLDFRVAPTRNSTLTNYERKQSLTEEFGSRKKKKAMRAAQSNIISSENIAGVAALEVAVSSEGLDAKLHVDAADEALEKSRKALLPPYNPDAIEPKDAFPIDGLLPPQLEEVLEKHFTAICENIEGSGHQRLDISAWRDHFVSEGASQIVLNTLVESSELLQQNKKKQKAFQKRVARVYYMHYLILFYNFLVSKYDFSAAREDIESTMFNPPAEVLDFFSKGVFGNRKMFKAKSSIQSTRVQLDKVLIYVILMGVSLCGYSDFDATMLSKDIKLPEAKVSQLAREAGCKVAKKSVINSSGAAHFISLEAPLVFPQRKRAKR